MIDQTMRKTDLVTRLNEVQDRCNQAAVRAGRDRQEVAIVAVSKTVAFPAIQEAADCGIVHFGENRVHDVVGKWTRHELPGAVLHMIGQLQSNKAKQAARLFDVIESVDRMSLIAELDRAAGYEAKMLPVLLQVNVAGEQQKAGCLLERAPDLAAAIESASNLRLEGLMTMAPLTADPEDVRPVFAGLRQLRDGLRRQLPDSELNVLSMGMSNDFEVAIEEGATHVRIGRAIFGE